MNSAPIEPAQDALDLDLSNLAEINRVAVNPSHVTHVRLTGVRRMNARKMEVHLVSGAIVTMSFDEESDAAAMFVRIVEAMGFTAPVVELEPTE